MKLAATLAAAIMLTVQVLAMPLHEPDHPANVEPDAAVAVKVTLVPEVNGALQTAPHEMPAGVLATVPLPAPALVTASV